MMAKIAAQVYDKKEAQEAELKYRDDRGALAVPVVGGIVNITEPIALGTAYLNRIGDKVIGKQFLMRYTVSTEVTAANVRVILFRWLDAGQPVVLDILENIATNPAHSNIQVNASGRIQILYDNLHALSTYGPAVDAQKVFIKRNMQLHWTTSNTAQKGQIHLLYICDDISGATRIRYNMRFRFTDS